MKILADQNMPLVEEYFADLGSVTRFDGRNAKPEQIEDVDILLTRSVTKVNAELLRYAKKLKFVGTATIGIDHIDTELLDDKEIAFSSAPGCNAVAVAEYVISAIYAYAQETSTSLQGKTLGIVGVGNIGQCLREKLQGSGINLLLCDPIKFENGELQEHIELDNLLAQSDIVSFHVPLVKTGKHKTLHLIDSARIAKLKDNMLVINACRGEVIDNQALLESMQTGKQLELVLDVWENEPNILTELLPFVRYSSVHIAGHTLEGKARGTQMLYQKVCELLNFPAEKQLSDFLPNPVITEVTLQDNFSQDDLGRLAHLVYDLRRDDGILRKSLSEKGFDHLRKSYPVRREFSTVTVKNNGSQFAEQLATLGFTVSE
ncbi:4-phosphoerythronate dehydrogenase [Pseudoalteromonas phenolica]|uniref:Erythronate-4-phosphate dehydrogenase n=1 Tax=Pseudoalteromonas phenolica TaxID=161398 RepID=A0A0S2K2Q4_9GAMM|nr:4-phosphoerythronate dehydrogenase [Pseudoalteromonas phenolica]ALO42582.1 Erythronate-4-phosphate dehydrogenase [Pseudoalteromonas phenolica]MBE0356312.1 erythronate-4-phosphate dehydrogenase [Pseudoalteromonas phenolica O-BC30]RXF06890.1 erythronate-4-phosphate dehydrogenase [Pseudoalteromonas phenolica O-BC30]